MHVSFYNLNCMCERNFITIMIMILSIVIFIMSHEKQFNEIMNETNLFEINKSISNVSNFNLMENIM